MAKEGIVCACAWGRVFSLNGDVWISQISQNCSFFDVFWTLLTFENKEEPTIALNMLATNIGRIDVT